MTAHVHLVLPPQEEPSGRRWVFAAILVVLVHGGLVYWLSRRVEPLNPAGAPDSAIMIELPPMEAAQPAPGSEVPPEPLLKEAPPEPLAEPPSEPEKAQPPQAEPVPELAPAPKPDAVLVAPEKPIPKVEPKPKIATKPKVEPKPERKILKERPNTEKREVGPRASRAGAPARQSAGAPGQTSQGAAGSSMSAGAWRNLMFAAINRNRPASAPGSGRSTIAFTIDRSGRLVAANILSSSGSPALDQAALSAVRRANPFPPPPPAVAGARVTLSVPINFH